MKASIFRLLIFYFILLFFPLAVSSILPGFLGQSWKQLLWIILFFLMLMDIIRFKNKDLYIIQFFFLFVFLFFHLIYTSIIQINLIRFIFGIWIYFLWVPFYYFFHKINSDQAKKMNKIFLFIIFIISFGLIVDGLFSIYSILPFISRPDLELIRPDGILGFRASLFFETPSGISIMMNIFLFYVLFRVRNIYLKYFLLFVIIFAGFLTGTRLLMVGLALQFLFYIIFISKLREKSIILFLCILIAINNIDLLENIIDNNAIILRFFESKDETGRYSTWNEGFKLFTKFDSFSFYFGNGLSTSTNQNSLPTEIVLPHYESSFLYSYSELGIFGLLIFFIPIFLLVNSLNLKQSFGFTVSQLTLILFIFIVGLTTPTYYHYSAQVSIPFLLIMFENKI